MIRSGVLLLVVIPVALILIITRASSLNMTNRSIAVSTTAPGATATHDFRFDVPTVNNVGSLVFEYCTNSPLQMIPCVAPLGLNVTGASLTSQTTNTGFSFDSVNSTTNRIVITRTAANTVIGSSTYTFTNVTNQTTSNQTVFVRISSHAASDGTGAFIDEGTVAYASTITGFSVGLFVPPYLTFCVGQTVAVDCSSTSGALVSFGEFRTSSAVYSTTQMAAATNDFDGYNIFISGQTLTSGNNVIAALSSLSPSTPGVAQFGFNLTANSSPSVGSGPSGPGNGTPTPNYNTANQFRFVAGEVIAGATTPSDNTRYTVSYIVNVPTSQPPGIYATTLTYMAVATF